MGLDSNQLPPGVLPGVLPEALPTHVPSYRTINGAGLFNCRRRRKKDEKNIGWGAADHAQRPRGVIGPEMPRVRSDLASRPGVTYEHTPNTSRKGH